MSRRVLSSPAGGFSGEYATSWGQSLDPSLSLEATVFSGEG